MTAPKFTPGPWQVFRVAPEDGHEGDSIWQINGRHPVEGFQPEQDCQLARVYSVKENALLISAAPEMFEALILVQKAWSSGLSRMPDALDALKAALIKATAQPAQS